jgi:Putative sensor
LEQSQWDTTSGSQPRTGNWATRGAVAAGRGVVLFGFAVASLILEAVLLTSVAPIPVGVSLPLTAVALRAIRGLQASAWRNEDGWSGFAAPAPCPAGQQEPEQGFWVRFGSLMADPGTWRSVVWSTVNILAGGWLLVLAPVALQARTEAACRRRRKHRADVL